MASGSSDSSPGNSSGTMESGISMTESVKGICRSHSPASEPQISQIQSKECFRGLAKVPCHASGSVNDNRRHAPAATPDDAAVNVQESFSTAPLAAASSVPISDILKRALEAAASDPARPSAPNGSKGTSATAASGTFASPAAAVGPTIAASAPPSHPPEPQPLSSLPPPQQASPVQHLHAGTACFTEPISIPGALHLLPLVPEDALATPSSPFTVGLGADTLSSPPFPDTVSSPPFHAFQVPPLVLDRELPDESVHGGMPRHSLASASGSGLACVDWVESCCPSPCPSLPTNTRLRYSASIAGSGPAAAAAHHVTTWSLSAQLLAAKLREQQPQQQLLLHQQSQQVQMQMQPMHLADVHVAGGRASGTAVQFEMRRRSMEERSHMLGAHGRSALRLAAESGSHGGWMFTSWSGPLTSAVPVVATGAVATAAVAAAGSGGLAAGIAEEGNYAEDLGMAGFGAHAGAATEELAGPLAAAAFTGAAAPPLPESDAATLVGVRSRRLSALQLGTGGSACPSPQDLALRNAVRLAPTSVLAWVLLQRLLVACMQLPLALAAFVLMTPVRFLAGAWRSAGDRKERKADMYGKTGYSRKSVLIARRNTADAGRTACGVVAADTPFATPLCK